MRSRNLLELRFCAGLTVDDLAIDDFAQDEMTATETITDTIPPLPRPAWRRAFVFGTGFGIVISHGGLDLAIVRLRPSGARLVAETTIADFRARPAAQWGMELDAFLKRAGESRLAATLLLPRDEVIVRALSLPGVSDQDVESAIEIQADTLHPYGDEEVVWGWSRCGAGTVLAGFVRRSLVDSYETLFNEAGVTVAAISFSPAAIYPALRIWNEAPDSLLCFYTGEHGRMEVYGESAGRALYSAAFPGDAERALAVSRAELRLAPEYPAIPLYQALSGSRAGSALVWAAAVAGGAPRSQIANLLPPERRASHDRMQYLLPVTLGVLLVIVLVIVFGILPALEKRRYREELDRAARSLEPAALRAQGLERTWITNRGKLASLDEFRLRPQADLEVLNELTRLLQPPVWTSSIEIFPDLVTIVGEADQAAPLLKILDSSPLFQNSEFSGSVARLKDSEQFRIRTMRRGRTGRKTP